ncbi:MAG: hypothetical protein U5L04_09825 [Trueperaceae bacterium]|nr:hypothetical protein [Trueperaceae bacterium]
MDLATAALTPVLGGGSPLDELITHRVEAFVQRFDLDPGPALDAVRAAYTAGLRDGGVTLSELTRARNE